MAMNYARKKQLSFSFLYSRSNQRRNEVPIHVSTSEDWEIRIFIDENDNIEKHRLPYSLQKWSKTAQRWHDIMKSRQMYDTEIRNKTIIKIMISDKSLIRQLNKKHSLIKLKKGELNTKAELKSECFILFSLFVHNKVLQILQINGKTID